MGILDERNKTAKYIAEGRFIDFVLKNESESIDADIDKVTNKFKSNFWINRDFSITNNTLIYTSLKKHRFLDMKTRLTNNGVVFKERHQIHNKPIFGHLNNIVRELSFGFTDAVKAKFHKLE